MFQNNTAEKARCQPTFTCAAENFFVDWKWWREDALITYRIAYLIESCE